MTDNSSDRLLPGETAVHYLERCAGLTITPVRWPPSELVGEMYDKLPPDEFERWLRSASGSANSTERVILMTVQRSEREDRFRWPNEDQPRLKAACDALGKCSQQELEFALATLIAAGVKPAVLPPLPADSQDD